MCVFVFFFLLFHFRFPPSKYPLGMCICHIRNTRYDKVELFFFLKAGSSAVIILKVFTTPLSFFFFLLLLLSRVTLLSLFCVYVCVYVRSCFLFSTTNAQSMLILGARIFWKLAALIVLALSFSTLKAQVFFFPLFLHHRSSSHTPFSFYFSLDSLGMLLGH